MLYFTQKLTKTSFNLWKNKNYNLEINYQVNKLETNTDLKDTDDQISQEDPLNPRKNVKITTNVS